MDDLKNNTRLHTDIIIKNIRPIYFSITSEDTSYLFVYINYADEIGIDIELNTQIIIREHE